MMNQFTLKNVIKICVVATILTFSFHCKAQWNLVWQDEFNGSIGPDWVFETGTGSGGWGNNEQQYYRRENAGIRNGQLIITARRESYGGMNYTSARMKTQGRKSWRYGRIEARIAMPSFMGVWPAFWMLGDNISSAGWPACGEIDIMEHVNTEQSTHGTVHWQDHNGNYASYGGSTGVSVSQFHVYAIEWDESLIKWFVDGNQYHEVNISGGVNGTGEFHNNFFILLNMAIGGNWPGFNIDNGAFPAELRVDYVRVYSGSGGGNNFSQTIEAENYAVQSGIQTENCSEGGLNVGWIDNNDWMVWDINIPSNGNYLIEYRVASPYNSGVLQFEKAGGSPVYGTRTIPYTGSWQNWTTVSHTVSLTAGQQQIAIKALSGGWNINWLRVSSSNNGRSAITEEQSASAEKLVVYPNPVKGDLTIRLSSEEILQSVTIYNMSGKQVMSQPLSATNQANLDVAHLAKGHYLISIETSSGKKVSRIVKE